MVYIPSYPCNTTHPLALTHPSTHIQWSYTERLCKYVVVSLLQTNIQYCTQPSQTCALGRPDIPDTICGVDSQTDCCYRHMSSPDRPGVVLTHSQTAVTDTCPARQTSCNVDLHTVVVMAHRQAQQQWWLIYRPSCSDGSYTDNSCSDGSQTGPATVMAHIQTQLQWWLIDKQQLQW